MTIIDCYTCPVRGRHCGDCVVPVVARQWLPEPGTTSATTHAGAAPAGAPAGAATPAGHHDELQDAEWDAVEVFVRAGMINTLDAADAWAVVSAQAWSHAG